MKLAVLTALAFGAALTSTSFAATPAAHVFDSPTNVKSMTTPAKGETPKTKITCNYFARFMVKEVDEGEVGAAQLSIVPVAAGKLPACQRANVEGEKVVDAKDWGGYFQGVNGDYVFFTSGDGVNGAMPFAVFGTDAKKLFDDTVFGEFHSVETANGTLTFRYQRSLPGPCSAAKDGASCWQKIVAATGVKPATEPDCAAGYLKAKTAMAKARCEDAKTPGKSCMDKALKELDVQKWNDSPSVVVYEAKTVIASGKPTTSALGAALSCSPAD